MAGLIRRLMRSEQGQDVIEYALLTAALGLAGIASWPAITQAIGLAYQTFDTQTQAIWETPPPSGS